MKSVSFKDAVDILKRDMLKDLHLEFVGEEAETLIFKDLDTLETKEFESWEEVALYLDEETEELI